LAQNNNKISRRVIKTAKLFLSTFTPFSVLDHSIHLQIQTKMAENHFAMSSTMVHSKHLRHQRHLKADDIPERIHPDGST